MNVVWIGFYALWTVESPSGKFRMETFRNLEVDAPGKRHFEAPTRGNFITLCRCQGITPDAPRGDPGTRAGHPHHPSPGKPVSPLYRSGGGILLHREPEPVTHGILRPALVFQGLLNIDHGRLDAAVTEHALDFRDGRSELRME